MESFKAFFKSVADRLPPLAKTLLILVLAFLGVLLLLRICLETATWVAYSYYFHIITSQGGINAWLARAVSVGFAAAFWFGLRMYFSITSKKRRAKGLALLVGTFVAFNLFMYACTRSVVAVPEGPSFVPETGEARSWYYVTDDGDWEFFPAPGYHPRTGEKLKPMTPATAREYEAWKRRNTQQSEKQRKNEEGQRKIETEGRFRQTYLNEGLLSSAGPGANVVLAIKTDGADSQGDSLKGCIAQLLTKGGKKTLSGVFRPAFYDSLFDDVWKGDESVLARLRLFDATGAPLLLGRASFSSPDKTDFEGLVSVQGALSMVRLTKDGRSGPWSFRASGAGETPAVAAANCAKRLAEAVDLDVVFEK